MFHLQLFCIRLIVHDRSDSESENLLPPLHGLPISSKDFFYMCRPTDRIVTPVVEHWLGQEIAHEGLI